MNIDYLVAAIALISLLGGDGKNAADRLTAAGDSLKNASKFLNTDRLSELTNLLSQKDAIGKLLPAAAELIPRLKDFLPSVLELFKNGKSGLFDALSNQNAKNSNFEAFNAGISNFSSNKTDARPALPLAPISNIADKNITYCLNRYLSEN